MVLSNFNIGDKVVFTGTLESFELNKIYTISRIYTIDYFVDEIDRNFGRECVNFNDSKYGCFLIDLPEQFTKLDSLREEKINSIVQRGWGYHYELEIKKPLNEWFNFLSNIYFETNFIIGEKIRFDLNTSFIIQQIV